VVAHLVRRPDVGTGGFGPRHGDSHRPSACNGPVAHLCTGAGARRRRRRRGAGDADLGTDAGHAAVHGTQRGPSGVDGETAATQQPDRHAATSPIRNAACGAGCGKGHLATANASRDAQTRLINVGIGSAEDGHAAAQAYALTDADEDTGATPQPLAVRWRRRLVHAVADRFRAALELADSDANARANVDAKPGADQDAETDRNAETDRDAEADRNGDARSDARSDARHADAGPDRRANERANHRAGVTRKPG
jgi:hypothetical protein